MLSERTVVTGYSDKEEVSVLSFAITVQPNLFSPSKKSIHSGISDHGENHFFCCYRVYSFGRFPRYAQARLVTDFVCCSPKHPGLSAAIPPDLINWNTFFFVIHPYGGHAAFLRTYIHGAGFPLLSLTVWFSYCFIK